MKYAMIIFLSLASFFCLNLAIGDEPAAKPSLYQRLGEMEGIENIVAKTIELHESNPTIAAYVAHIDQDWLVGSVTAFFAAGTGGPNSYTGVDMVTAHAHLDLTNEEFDAAVSDVLAAAEAHNVDADSRAEVNDILQSFRGAIVTDP